MIIKLQRENGWKNGVIPALRLRIAKCSRNIYEDRQRSSHLGITRQKSTETRENDVGAPRVFRPTTGSRGPGIRSKSTRNAKRQKSTRQERKLCQRTQSFWTNNRVQRARYKVKKHKERQKTEIDKMREKTVSANPEFLDQQQGPEGPV